MTLNGAPKIFVVGIGSGNDEDMTNKAITAIASATVVVGYTKYIELIAERISGKRIISTGMTQEVKRCDEAVRLAAAGETVAVVSGGDAGVYGMAGLLLERVDAFRKGGGLLDEKAAEVDEKIAEVDEKAEGSVYVEPTENAETAEREGDVELTKTADAREYKRIAYANGIDVEIIPGVTAALSGAAALGAPLSHDFCVISLSDILTPQELIDRRAEAIGMGDFCCAVYNPMSKGRRDKLSRLCDILLKHKSPDTICGFVRNIGRKNEAKRILTLCELRDAKVDMSTTIFIGNASTKVINGKMVTPRGYCI